MKNETTIDAFKLPRREALGYFLNEAGLLGDAAEIGCAYGANARTLLAQWQGKRLYLVDPWEKQPDYLEHTNDTAPFDQWYADCVALAEQDPRATIIRKRSTDGAVDIPDGSLDLVYLDGAHDLRNVLADIDAWWPKLKRGGIFGGHDFYDSREGGGYCEVASAVTRWTKERGFSFAVLPCTSWFMIKPDSGQ